MSQERIIIKDKQTDKPIASAILDDGVILFEGAWYFDPKYVDQADLTITKRTYDCPYKGICHWIDLGSSGQKMESVGWTYFDIKPGYEFIKDWIAFYVGEHEATREENQFID